MVEMVKKRGRPKRIEDDALSSSIAKGERLKRLRNLANLSREEFCNNSEVNLTTLISWERGRFGGLSNKGAEKVISRVAKEGVFCTLEWLLNEIGSGPEVQSDYKKIHTKLEIVKDDILLSEKAKIIEELMVFRKLNKNAVDYIVEDDAMAPNYLPGDYVAGTTRAGENIISLTGHNCIIQTINGEMFIRHLKQGSKAGFYNLVPLNIHTQVNAYLCDVQLISAAPILWHRKREPSL